MDYAIFLAAQSGVLFLAAAFGGLAIAAPIICLAGAVLFAVLA